jgi:hypothetical protein
MVSDLRISMEFTPSQHSEAVPTVTDFEVNCRVGLERFSLTLSTPGYEPEASASESPEIMHTLALRARISRCRAQSEHEALQSPHAGNLPGRRFHLRSGQEGHAVSLPLAVADDEVLLAEIDVLDPEAEPPDRPGQDRAGSCAGRNRRP